jgi:hypothetical protein
MHACTHACMHTAHTCVRTHTRPFPLTRLRRRRAGGVCASAIRRRKTPLHTAARPLYRWRADVVAALLTHGADVHAKDNDGCVLPYRVVVSGRYFGQRSARAVPPWKCRSGCTDRLTHTRFTHTHAYRCGGLHVTQHAHGCAHIGKRTCARASTRSYAWTTPTAARTPPHSHARRHTHTRAHARAHRCGCVVRMHGCIFTFKWGSARAQTRRRTHHPQSDKHSHLFRRSHARGLARTSKQTQPDARTRARARMLANPTHAPTHPRTHAPL